MSKDKKADENKNIDDSELEFYNDEAGEEDMDDIEEYEIEAQEKIRKLQKKLKKCEQEKSQYLDGWQRLKADYVNLKKRSDESGERSTQLAKEEVISSFFPIIDSFEMAMTGEAWENADDKWRNGLSSIYKQFISALRSNGIEEMNPVEEEFDPHIHTSVSTQDTADENKDNKIAEVLQKGYQLQTGEVLRSPKVVVYSYEK
ncbi:MAG: nucleotide exchange factor GrpE [Candidatus Campbellbacteria bacterium]|nr:nucleotide exchange factor GrpE [Candidatus Campbellbacteria bacterium]